MYELIEIGENASVFRAPTNIGLIYTNSGVVLIDTGYGDDKVRKLLKKLGEGARVFAVINTHSHADHVDGNPYLVKRTGAKVYAPIKEAPMIEHPDLYMRQFFNQATPPLPRGERFMVAHPSKVHETISAGELKLGDVDLTIVDLPGHSIGQVGVLLDSGVFFIGDGVFTKDILEKYPLIFYVDIEKLYQSFNNILAAKADVFVAGHGEAMERGVLKDTIKVYKERVEEVNEKILGLTDKPRTLEEIIQLTTNEMDFELNMEQYYLTKTIISAHISYLTEKEKIQPILINNKLAFQATG